MAVDATGVSVEDGRVVVDRSAFAGSWETRCAVTTPFAIVAPAAALVAWVLVGLVAPDVARVWTRWRSGEPAEAAGPGGGARGSRQPADGAPSSRGERRWPWLAASVDALAHIHVAEARALDRFEQLFARARECGDLAESMAPRTAAWALQTYVRGIYSSWLREPEAFALEENAEALLDVFFNGLPPGAARTDEEAAGIAPRGRTT